MGIPQQTHQVMQCQSIERTYLHPMRREPQLLLVAPQHLGTGLDGRSGQKLVEVGDLILAMIADQDQHRPLAGHDGALDERPDAGVELLPDHVLELLSTTMILMLRLTFFFLRKVAAV